MTSEAVTHTEFSYYGKEVGTIVRKTLSVPRGAWEKVARTPVMDSDIVPDQIAALEEAGAYLQDMVATDGTLLPAHTVEDVDGNVVLKAHYQRGKLISTWTP